MSRRLHALRWQPVGPAVVCAGVVYAAVVAALASGLAGWAADDFFITYRYAAHLAAGHGLVFDPGERVFGTTAPGLALLLGALAAVTRVPVPLLGTVVTALSVWTVALLLLGHGRRQGRAAEGFAAGLLVAGAPFLWVHAGGEAPLVLALLLGAAALAGRCTGEGGARGVSRLVAAGVLAGLAAWCRPDAVVGAGLLGLLLLLLLVGDRRRAGRGAVADDPAAGRMEPGPTLRGVLSYGVAVVAIVGAGLLAARWWFGEWLPATLAAKRLQAAIAPDVWVSGEEVWGAAYRAVQDSHAGAATPLLVVLGAVGLPLLAGLGRHGGSEWPGGRPLVPVGGLRGAGGIGNGAGLVGPLLVLHALALLVAYPLLGVGFYPWYASPWVVAFTAGAAWAAGAVARLAVGGLSAARRRGGPVASAGAPGSAPSRPAGRALAAVLALLLLAPLFLAEGRRAAWLLSSAAVDPRYEAYRRAGEWIDQATPPAAEIATLEVGILGYFSRRPVRDLLGLVTPESLPHLARRDLPGAFFAGEPPELFVLWEPLAPFAAPLLADPRFAAGWRPAARLRASHAGWPELVIYRRAVGAAGEDAGPEVREGAGEGAAEPGR